MCVWDLNPQSFSFALCLESESWASNPDKSFTNILHTQINNIHSCKSIFKKQDCDLSESGWKQTWGKLARCSLEANLLVGSKLEADLLVGSKLGALARWKQTKTNRYNIYIYTRWKIVGITVFP